MLAVFGVAAAAAEDEDPVAKPPQFNGSMAFPSIQSSAGAEHFLWEVQVQPGQELVQLDERHAEVLHEDGPRAFSIVAERARDATGTEVPTSLSVIDSNHVRLTVHHRAGNPAAAGTPFRYPVSAGEPYTVGYSTVTVLMPPGEVQESSPPPCVVPRLAGRSLAATRTRLTAAGCALGAVRGKRGKGARVVKQFRAAGTVLATGARVAIKLG
jgi:hypothetical protein